MEPTVEELLADLRRERERNAELEAKLAKRPDRIPDDEDFEHGQLYSEDGYCVACGNGSWKGHTPYCKIRDLQDANADHEQKRVALCERLDRANLANAELLEALRPICNRWVGTPVYVTDAERHEFEHAADVLRKHGGEA